MAEHNVAYAPTEDQELIRSTARQFLEEKVGPGRVRELMMSDDGFDRVLWKEMADLGWMGLSVPEELGGAGLGPVEVGVLLEEMGRLVTPGPFFASAVVATTAVLEIGDTDQQRRLLPELVAGAKIATLAVFEDARGWEFERPATTASAGGDGWVLNGAKLAVLDGHIADLLLVTAAIDGELGVLVVPTDAGGVNISPSKVLDPTRRQATVRFDDVKVEESARLGAGNVVRALTRTLQVASVALANEQVGGAEHCMESSVEYAKSRYQFGRPIGSYQSIKHRCANMAMKVEHARSAAYYGLRVIDDSEELAVAGPLAASVASEAYLWVAGENIQVHGGIGFTWEHDAHIYFKRAKASSLLFGSPTHQRDLMGNAIGI